MWKAPLLAILALLLLPVAAGADPHLDARLGFCFPNSAGPAGCDAPQRRIEAARRPELVLPDRAVEPLNPRRGALAELDRAVPIERRPLGLRRTRTSEVLQPVPGEPLGRDPQAVQRFQTPYSFERRDSLGRNR